MKEEIHIQIEAYLGGSMTPDEVKAFEAKMAVDTALAKEVDLCDSINHHLRDESWKAVTITSDSEDKKALDAYFESKEAQNLKKNLLKAQQNYTNENITTVKKSFPFLKYAAAVAVILVSAFAYFVFQAKPYDELYVAYYNQKDLPSLVTRGVSEEALSKGVIAFQQKNFQAALEAFDTYTKTNEEVNPLVYSYIGMAHLEQKTPDKAIATFDQLLNSDSIDKSKALWYKSLVYLKMGQKEKLQETLKQIIANPGNFNYEKAKALLSEL